MKQQGTNLAFLVLLLPILGTVYNNNYFILVSMSSSALALIGDTFQARIGIWKCWFLRRGENRSTRGKNLSEQRREPTTNSTHMTPGPGIEPGTHWCEASALTTAPSLLPYDYDLFCSCHCSACNPLIVRAINGELLLV